MDFGDLIILIIFLAPFLGRLFGKKQPKPAVPPTQELTERQIEDPLADALRQIREALGDQTLEREPEANPAPAVSLPVRSFHAEDEPEEFLELGEFAHERHGFGAENPLSEELFEQQPAFVTTGSTERIALEVPPPVDLTEPLQVKTLEPVGGTALQDILGDPQRARDAFILHEVFDAPRSHKPWRRR